MLVGLWQLVENEEPFYNVIGQIYFLGLSWILRIIICFFYVGESIPFFIDCCYSIIASKIKTFVYHIVDTNRDPTASYLGNTWCFSQTRQTCESKDPHWCIQKHFMLFSPFYLYILPIRLPGCWIIKELVGNEEQFHKLI